MQETCKIGSINFPHGHFTKEKFRSSAPYSDITYSHKHVALLIAIIIWLLASDLILSRIHLHLDHPLIDWWSWLVGCDLCVQFIVFQVERVNCNGTTGFSHISQCICWPGLSLNLLLHIVVLSLCIFSHLVQVWSSHTSVGIEPTAVHTWSRDLGAQSYIPE